MKKMLRILVALTSFGCLAHGYDLNILIVGSTHSFSEQLEPDVVDEKPFNPATIATHLLQIIDQDPAISESANVEFEDIYKTKTQTVVYSANNPNDFTSHCYSLAQHYMWPDGKTNRLANLRGEGTHVWDYIVLCNDPYITANFPGMVAEGVKLIKQEVAKSANPAQVVLLGQWPESSSTFTATQFNEIAYRVGTSAGLNVVPAGKAWDSYSAKDTNADHPTPRGEYLAAAAIYSKLFNRSAKASTYDFPSDGDAIADHALSVIQANAGVAQYSGTYTSFNPFQMKYLTKRVVSYRETGTSTEDRMAQALDRLDDVQRISLTTTGYAGVPGTRWDFNYGRGNDWWEDDKDYEVDTNKYDWVYGFPMHHYSTTSAPITMPYGIDKHYYYATTYEDGTDLGIPYNMIRPNTREPDWPEAVRAIPIRLMWQKMCEVSPGFNPLGDSTHMHPNLNDASVAFMYTLLSGRCPVEPEPAVATTSTIWMQWLGHKTGYETAWQMSHLTTRAPGFRVLPSATAATTVTPTTKETMTVVFLNPPQSDVTVNISISNTNAAIVGSKQLVFTPQNYNVPQNVTVAGLPGSAASEAFNVVFTTVSTDEIYDGLSDSWAYTINRSAPVTLTRVNKATIQATAYQNLPVTINLNTAGATSSNTIMAGPSRGTTTWSGSDVIYTPGSDFVGKDGFSFATTNAGNLSVGYVDITVTNTVPNGMVSYRGNGAEGGAVPVDTNSYAQSAPVTVLGNTGNLTRVGYNFDGWNTATNGTGTSYNAGATFAMGTSGVVLYAQWISVPTYTVTFNGNANNGGVVPSNQIKTDGVDLTLRTNIGALTRNGYTYAGWNTLATGTGTDYVAGGIYSGNTNITLYAKWTPNNYTVTFNANGGGTPSPTSKVVTYASTYGDLATVSYPGYTLNGWFTATNGGTRILSTTTVNITANQTLYAQWTAGETYTVSYDANGADSGTVPSAQTKLQDVELTLATNTGGLARVGYTFAGWNTAADSSGTPYAAGAAYTTNAAAILYAQWAGAETYPVTYDGNGNTGGSVPSDQTKLQGVGLALATNSGNLAITGFSFTGWNTAQNGSGTAYAAGSTYTADTAVTLYAQWNTLPVVDAGSSQFVILSEGSSWSPSLLTPQLWLDASTATINAGTVSVVNAGSGGGTFSGPAALAAGGIGSLQAVQFNTSKYLTGDYTNTGTTLSAFFVGKSLNTTQTAYAGMMSVWANDQANDWNNIGSAVLFNQNNTTANSVQTYRSAALSSTTGTLTDGFLAETVFNGTTNIAYINGTPATGVTSSGSFNAGKVVLGARRHTSVFNYSWNGNFGEAIICNTNLDTTDREKVEGYLAHKWGIAGNLGVNHPYKDSAPGGSAAVVTLDGSATDTDALTTAWTVIDGPVAVTFSDASAIDSTATFNVAGTYTLRLTANDGYGSVSDDVVIIVNDAGSLHSVTYNGNGNTGGTVPVDASSPYTNGAPVTVLGNTGSLVRVGYTFAGWNSAEDGSGTAYSSGATFNINAQVILYARWTANSYTVTYDANEGGAPSPSSDSVTFGSAYGTLATSIRAGYTFNGWFTAASGGTQVTSGTTVATAENHTLYAQWTVSTYPVTYDGNGNTGGTAPSDQTKTYGISLTLATNTGNLTRTGYTFNGWNTAPDGAGTYYAPEANYTINDSLALYAQWTANSYTVTFDGNNGTAPSPLSASVTFGSAYGTLASTSRTNYTFNGWFTTASGGTEVTAATSVTNASNHTLYAQWLPDTYVVSYQGNGNTSGTAPADQVKIHDINLTLASNSGNLAKTGHAFIGWNTETNGSGTAYASGSIYSANAAVTLYAQWIAGTFLTWDANGAATNQTNGGGGWDGSNLWWNGTGNQNWASGASAIFGVASTAGGAVTLAGPTTVESLTFNQFSGTYTLGTASNAITINNGINKTAASATVSIISPVTLGGPQTWVNNSTTPLTASSTLANGGHTLTVDGTGTLTMPGVISGNGGIEKNGSGRFSFGASGNANTYTGPTTINGGILSIANNSASLGSGNLTLNGGVLGFYWSSGLTRTLGTSSNQVTIPGGESGFGGDGTSGPTINIGATIIWGASGQGAATGHFNPSKFVLGSPDTSNAGATTFSTGIDMNGTTRTIVVPKGLSAGGNVSTISGAITSTGAAGLIKEGNGTLVISAANTFTGDTSISGGTLRIGNNTAGTLNSGNYAGNISIASGATLQIWSSAAQVLSGTISGGGGLNKAYGGALTLSGSNTYSGRTSFLPQTTAGCTVNITSFNSVNGGTPLMASSSLGAPTTVTNGTIDVGDAGKQAGVTLNYTGPGETTDRVINFGFNGTASQTLTASGSGLLKFTSAMTGNALGTQSGKLNLGGTGSGEITQALPALPSGGLSKNDSGTWTLGGANSYTGPTAITAGKLFINSDQSSATGNVSVAANATLGGTGTLGGNTTIAANGKLEFNLSTAAGSHNGLDLASAKSLTFSGASVLTITSSGGAAPGIYTLVTAPGGITGSAPATLNLPEGWAATVSISSNSLLLDVTQVPSTAYEQWLIEFYGTDNVDDAQITSNGINTIREAYIIGLNPTNATEQFIVTGTEAPADTIVLNWNSTSGRVYNIYWSSNMLGGADSFQLLHSNLPWNANSFTNTEHSGLNQGFYRIDVQLE